jgi:hypothetical protein
MRAQITCLPPSLASVSQVPFRYQPVLDRLQQGCKASPKTFFGPFSDKVEIIILIEPLFAFSSSKKKIYGVTDAKKMTG